MRQQVKQWYSALVSEDWDSIMQCGLQRIVRLCMVNIPDDVCNTIAVMWRTPGRVISIKKIQLCPTIEEFLSLFGTKDNTVVSAIAPVTQVSLAHVSAFLGVDEREVDRIVDGDKLSVTHICNNLRQHRNSQVRSRAFILAFTGCHLLHGKGGLFSMKVIPILEECLAGASIVPLVIGQLLDSLDNFWSDGATLSCPQLFAIWAFEHLRLLPACPYPMDNKIDDFIHRYKPVSCNDLDYHMFHVATPENICWQINHWDVQPRFWANYGSRCRILLPTLEGTTFYIPSVIARQYGFKQDRPIIEEPFPVCTHCRCCKIVMKDKDRLKGLFSQPGHPPFPQYLQLVGNQRSWTNDYTMWRQSKQSFLEDSDDAESDEESKKQRNGSEEDSEDDTDDEDMDE